MHPIRPSPRICGVIHVRCPHFLPLCALVLVAASCGDSGDSGNGGGGPGGPARGAATPPDTIVIANFDFSPEVLQVRVGATITVDNRDDAEHTVTASDRSFDTGPVPTGKATFTVTRVGRFEYVCEIHPFMPHRFVLVVG